MQKFTTIGYKKCLNVYCRQSNFEMFGTKRRQSMRIKVDEDYLPESLKPAIKHNRGSLLVLGCIP